MEELICPACTSENAYFDGSLYMCPDCAHEWTGEESEEGNAQQSDITVDSNGNPLSDGDSVTIIKDLKVKGSSLVLKGGTKVKNIRLTDDTALVDCKIDGTALVLKACFLKKA